MIIDVNENRFSPEFEDFVYEGKIKENKPKGTFVMNVTARDLDTVDLNSKITYSITGGDGLGIFAVNDQGLYWLYMTNFELINMNIYRRFNNFLVTTRC